MSLRRARAVLSVLAVSTAVMVIPASSAHALSFNWNCNFGLVAYNGCYSGSFHSWVAVSGGFDPVSGTYNGECVKAVTEAGNEKSGSACFPATVRLAGVTIAASPISEGYYYFGGSGTSYSNAGSEST